ncbi:MAG: cytochrome c biogenesis CcdA family protein, partial [Acidimicrobiales bacterium]
MLAAFGAGMLSFLSPCVLPLVPGYLSLVSGLSAAELGGAASCVQAMPEHVRPAHELALVGAAAPAPFVATGASSAPLPAVRRRPLVPLVRGILLFVAGFTLVFVALGASASGVHALLVHHKHALDLTSGAFVVALGLVLLSSSLPGRAWSRLGPRVAGRVGWLAGERRFHVRPEALGAWAAPVMGMAFAFAWTPCIGPVLGAVLALTYRHSTLGGGVVLL